MKNNRLKNSLIAAGIAVLAGVLVFSVNAAMGDAPGYDPPGAGVSPVFNNISATGNIEAQGYVYSATGLTAVAAFIDGSLNVQGTAEFFDDVSMNDVTVGTLDSTYGIDTSVLNTSSDVNIGGGLTVNGNIDANYLSTDTSVYAGLDSGAARDVIAFDDVIAADTIYAYNDVSSSDDIIAGDDLVLTGSGSVLYNNSGSVTISDAVKVYGNLTLGTGYQLGRFYTKYKYINASATTIDCDSGHTLMSCGASAGGTAALQYVFPSTGSSQRCYAGQDASTHFYIYARCFDPDGQ